MFYISNICNKLQLAFPPLTQGYADKTVYETRFPLHNQFFVLPTAKDF